MIIVLLFCSSCKNNVGSVDETNCSCVENQKEFLVSFDTTFVDYFIIAFNNNNIDSEYQKRMKNDSMSLDEITKNYLDSWKSEMVFTLNQVDVFVNDDEFRILQKNLMAWEEALTDLEQTKQKILFGSNRSKYGTIFYNDRELYLALQYREKVKELKYICFVLETNMDNSLFSKELKSLQFKEK